MGSTLKRMMCYVLCGRRREHEEEEEDEEVSETKPILQDSGEALTATDPQRPTPALKVPRPRSKDVQSPGQARRPPAPMEENTETCSATDPMGKAEGWEAAWNPMDFFVAPTDEEVEVEAAGLTQAGDQQDEVGRPEEKVEAVPCAAEAQPEHLTVERVEGMDTAPLVQISPQSPQAELTCLVEDQALPALTMQNPSEAITSGMVGLYSPCPVSWELLCSEWGLLEPGKPLFGALKQESQCDVPSAQGMESLPHAEPAGLGELLQPSHGVLRELEDEGSRECDAGEAELQHRTAQQTVFLGEPESCVPVPVKQEAEFSDVPLLLPEVLGSSEEIEDENVAA